MATRAQKVKVGVFILASVVLIVGGLLIISGFRKGDRLPYWLAFNESVLGLSKGGLVQYLGLPVGVVDNMYVSPQNVAHVEILVDPASVTLHEGVEAKLEIYSLATSTMCIALQGGDPTAPTLPPYSQIPTMPSLVMSVSLRIGQILDDLNDVIGQVKVGLEGFESGDLTRVVNEAEDLLAEGKEVLKEAKTTVADVRGDVDETMGIVRNGLDAYTTFAKKATTFVEKANEIADVAKQKVEPLDLAGIEQEWRGQFAAVAKRVETTADSFDEATKTMLHQTDNVQNSLRETLRAIDDALAAIRDLAVYLKEDPSSVVLGRGKRGGGGED